MSKIAYLQCHTGIAGDMFLGALVSAGVPLEYLEKSLESLNISQEYKLQEETVTRNGLCATKIHVHLTSHSHHHHHHRHLADIEHIINQSNLAPQIKANSLAIVRQLAIAEAKVHNTNIDKVHFHEVGAVDAIVDIVGTCIGLDYLGIEKLYCSPLPTGGGTVKAAHGILPVPVPAVLELLQSRKIPIYSNGIEKELVTPTGAAIAATLTESFGQPPKMNLEKIGNGAGSHDLSLPNVLRLWIGEIELSDLEEIAVLETQIDDCNPQILAYVLEDLLNIGAKDVFTQPVMMKKSRLGVLLTVICELDKISICENLIFRETTTLGIRRQIQQRSILEREIRTIKSKYGDIRLKIAKKNEKIVNVYPEYEDCATIARQLDIPINRIQWEVVREFYEKQT
ncbi:nickel pincer cofactor biosynthesis protein LarC [Cyanobacterium sp. Dongsha4]|uniref:nickel pincer cofactor biosynthesis protein LarC n=1 Tax=Cyanobacterium sp. DS4 TaxID=2878255 RepID=UPI002E804FC3|nr:nickel pincer cofactor biosynthesis protein LarC [Cyanobacterium sp. Dongsha4]WVK99019.1 nickel pincer cofactor biosynthesis protein LarC [Cyanobacterium sp. Dongsha4]